MYDCQCEPGTYEYSHRLAGLLIEEQNDAKNYVEKNKSKFLECAGMTDRDHEILLKKIDDGIEYNKKARPYYVTKLFFGESQVRDITPYKETRLDLVMKELERACMQLKSKDISVNSAGNDTFQIPRSTLEPTVQSTPELKAESAPGVMQSVNNKLMGDKIDNDPNAAPNTKEDAANKVSNKIWQDGNGFIHYPDGSISKGPVD